MKKEFLNLNNDMELQIYCNAVEVFRSKNLLTRLSSLSTFLTREYETQKKIILNRPDNMINFKDSLKYVVIKLASKSIQMITCLLTLFPVQILY
jgi:hypothetical protein